MNAITFVIFSFAVLALIRPYGPNPYKKLGLEPLAESTRWAGSIWASALMIIVTSIAYVATNKDSPVVSLLSIVLCSVAWFCTVRRRIKFCKTLRDHESVNVQRFRVIGVEVDESDHAPDVELNSK